MNSPQFVKTGALDPSLHEHLLDAFDLRNLGDYGAVHAVEDTPAGAVSLQRQLKAQGVQLQQQADEAPFPNTAGT